MIKVIDSIRFVILCFVIVAVTIDNVWSIGKTGLYVSRVKFEYEYCDYDQFTYPLIISDDPLRGYEYISPYIVDFPEHRVLTRIQQALGPLHSIELRHEYSDLNEYKSQQRYYFKYNRSLSDIVSLYGAYQHLAVTIDHPDSSSNTGGDVFTAGVKSDMSGWIKGEVAFSYDKSRDSNGLIIRTYKPMLNLRWSFNSITAISGRFEAYSTMSDSGDYVARAFTVIFSRYLPTKTALHLAARFYNNDYGIRSVSPTIELGHYLRWNLSARLNYRYLANRFDKEVTPVFIKGRSIKTHRITAVIDWQVKPDLSLRMKYRRYLSNQEIRMNTYLVSLEYEL